MLYTRKGTLILRGAIVLEYSFKWFQELFKAAIVFLNLLFLQFSTLYLEDSLLDALTIMLHFQNLILNTWKRVFFIVVPNYEILFQPTLLQSHLYHPSDDHYVLSVSKILALK